MRKEINAETNAISFIFMLLRNLFYFVCFFTITCLAPREG